MLSFRVAPEVFAQFPTYIVAGVVVSGLTAERAYPDLAEALAAANAACAERLRGVDPKTLPEIAAWRAAFQRLGISASTYPSAVEALARRTAKGNAVASISPYVDLGNLASLACLVPVGAHDPATWRDGALDVRVADPEDVFQPPGDGATETPNGGEIVYATGAEVRTRRWVWRQSARARIGPDTTTVFYPIDGFSDATLSHVRRAQALIAERAAGYGARVRAVLVDGTTPSAIWPAP
jgi:DNA/RNA-binding domain of Phe-tRNA-synthetase-like protein